MLTKIVQRKMKNIIMMQIIALKFKCNAWFKNSYISRYFVRCNIFEKHLH